MRRALRAAGLTALLVALPALLSAAPAVNIVNRINAIGLVDYNGRPTFKVGDYARYVVTNTGPGIDKPAYTLTVLIAGEEEFWGEKCFWVETWIDDPTGARESNASLMSYSIFADSLADERIQLYRRKTISGFEENGLPMEELTRGAANLSTLRSSPVRPFGYVADTLGADTVHVDAQVLDCRRVRLEQGKSLTQTVGDSTVYVENRESRVRWSSRSVPITHMAREETRDTQGRRAWKVGYSNDALPMNVKETSFTVARVVGFGHGLVSRLLPKERATSFAQQAARAGKPAPRTGSARRAAR